MGPGEFVGVFVARGVPEHAQAALEMLVQSISWRSSAMPPA